MLRTLKPSSLLVSLFGLLLLVVIVGRAGSAQAYSFSGLGVLPGGIINSEASGVSGDGSVVVGTSGSASGNEAFRWTEAGGMVGLGNLPGGSGSGASGVSGDGSVVVGDGNSSSSPLEAFRWTEAGGMVGLGFLPGSVLTISKAIGVSADGSVVVGGGPSSSGTEAFRWTESGGMVGLGHLPGGFFSSNAFAVSADGSVVVGVSPSSSGIEAFRWTESGGMVGLGDLPGGIFHSDASGVSADGSVVVGRSYSSSGNQAFVWDETNGMRALMQILEDQGVDMTGWNLELASGISADGLTIVGTGTNPLGFTEAWIATIPEPGTVLLVGIGLAGMSAVSQRHRRGTTRRN